MRFLPLSSFFLTTLFAFATLNAEKNNGPQFPIVYSDSLVKNNECCFYTYNIDTGPSGKMTLFAQKYGCDNVNYPIEGEYDQCQVGSAIRDCLVIRGAQAAELEFPVHFSSLSGLYPECNISIFGGDTFLGNMTLFIHNIPCTSTDYPIGYSRCMIYGRERTCIPFGNASHPILPPTKSACDEFVVRPSSNKTEKATGTEMPYRLSHGTNPNPECNIYRYGVDAGPGGVPTLYIFNEDCNDQVRPIEGVYGKCQVFNQVQDCLVNAKSQHCNNGLSVVHHSKADPNSKCNFFTYGLDGCILYVTNHECDESHYPIDYATCQVGSEIRDCVVVKRNDK